MGTSILITETAVFTALRNVLLGWNLLSSTANAVEIVRGQVNRVPQPQVPDFIVMWPLRRVRLATDTDTYQDNIITGLIASNVLVVTAITRGIVAAGQTINITTPPAVILRQLTGTPGGIGTYATTPTANIGSTLLYPGTVSLLQPIDYVIQLDIHGPASADNAHIISTLWRDYIGVRDFAAQGPGLSPLYTDDPHQAPFIDGEQQFEEKWTLDVHLQVDPLVIVTQQFADHLAINPITLRPYPIAVSVDALAIIAQPDLWDDNGVLVLLPGANYPTTASGLPAGAVWNDGLTIVVVPGVVPDPTAPAVFFGSITAAALLALGGGNLPTSDPGVLNQLWNNSGLVCVSIV